MAERRMIAKTIIDSDLFLDMPMSTQCLYFHLNMRADDDGFINNPKKIQRMIGCNDDDIKLLIAKNFIIPFESGVVVIKHWKIHNYIRMDRYKETLYKEEKSQLVTDKSKEYILGRPDDIPLVDQRLTQDRLGKDRLGKDSINNIVDSSESPTQIYESEFEQLWSMYPKKQGKKAALRHYKTWRKRSKDNTFEVMKEKLEHYLKFLKIKQTPLEYTLNGSTWFNGRFDDELDMTPPKPRYSQQPKTVHKATDWSKYQQHSSKPTMTTEERNKIFKEFGR